MSIHRQTARKVPYICTIEKVPPKEPPKLRVCMAGPAGAGKTSLVYRWRGFSVADDMRSTCGANFTVFDQETPEGRPFFEHIWDTAGQEAFASLLPFYLRGADVVVLVFDICEFEPELVRAWIDKMAVCNDGTRLAIVCNKADLVETTWAAEESLRVAQRLVALDPKFVLIGTFVTSCLSGSCCQEVHEAVVSYLGSVVRSKQEVVLTRIGNAADTCTQTEPKGCC